MKFLICALVSITGTFAMADTTKCSSGIDERILFLYPEGSGCKFDYTKAGTTSTLATQKVSNTKCVEVRDAVQAKLEAAGYKCEVAAADGVAYPATPEPAPATK